jgi:tetratricopeptide (TPR) repeat protein
VLDDSQSGRPEAAGALDAFWKLQVLYQRTSQYDQAVRLIQDQAGQWPGGLIGPRLNAEQGRLQVLLGNYQPARRLLADAVSGLERQSPLNLVALPSALLNLAVAELASDATDGRTRAEKPGRRCLELHRGHALAEDLVLVETYDLRGACSAQDGDYARAIDHFKAGVDCCARLGKSADVPRCNLLLNIALLHKAQGDVELALPASREAREIYLRFASPDDLALAALDAATAALLAAQARLDEADTLAADVLKRCEVHNIRAGPLVITARHCQALSHLYRRDFPAAERAWREVEKLYGPHSPLLPRTLNYLALTRECQDRLDKAAELYERARGLQKQNPLAFPVTQFTTLWRLANVADRRGRRAEARRLLGEAVAEQARLRTYGGPRQRSAFFAQFAPAFEQLVAWGVRDGDVAAAVVAAARGRSRTLLDQLLLANVDPSQGLSEEQGEKLRRQESDLRRRIAALRARVQQVPDEVPESDGARRLLADLGEAQQEYARVYGEILNASPVYRSVGGSNSRRKN